MKRHRQGGLGAFLGTCFLMLGFVACTNTGTDGLPGQSQRAVVQPETPDEESPPEEESPNPPPTDTGVCPCQANGRPDSDCDGLPDNDDNCPTMPNGSQIDTNNNGVGDVCECVQVTPPGGQVPPTQDGRRMTSGGSVFTDKGMRVTHGFQLRCDARDPRQNLEVNWSGGNRFHLTGITDVECTDTELDEEHPVAGFDTLSATGTGRYNGVDGATIELTFTDDGEPGTSDEATMTIRDASGNVVLEVSNVLRHGNHQAHPN